MDVIVLGGGYAGVTMARRLERSLPDGVDLTVVDESKRHLLQHELHRLIRHPSLVDDVTVPFEALFDRAAFVRGRVSAIDADAGVVTLADGTELPFDYAGIALGARTAYHDLPGVEANSTPLKRVRDAEAIRDRFLELIDAGGGRAVVGGAGLSGVQAAGELAALADERGVRESVEVVLLEQAAAVAPGFPTHFQAAVHPALTESGVEVRTGRAVTGATEDTIALDGDSLAVDQFVWTGGIRGPAPLGDERPTVPATLRQTDRTFVVGDAARVVDREGEVLPATAQAATAAARTAATNIDRLVRHDRSGGAFEPRLETVDFEARGWIVSVGSRTVAQVGPMVVRDAAALGLKTAVGARYLAGVGAVSEAVGLVRGELFTPAKASAPAEIPGE
jgi:NADH dehydrogenase